MPGLGKRARPGNVIEYTSKNLTVQASTAEELHVPSLPTCL